MPSNPNGNQSFRSSLARSTFANVDAEARILRGVAIITRGEALGHGIWIDGLFLDAVVAAGNASPKGLKARWTHPGMFADGMGTYLGRISNLSRDGDVVRGDLQLAESASASPQGDLAAYVMSLATEDPEAFGLSIVFTRDIEAESSFVKSNLSADGTFVSPDPDNKENYEHARLSTLYGADVVDEPAANPRGLFATLAEYLSRCGPFKYVIGPRNIDRKLGANMENKEALEAPAEEAPEEKKDDECEKDPAEAAEEGEMCPECGQPMPEGEGESEAPAEEESAEAEEEKPEAEGEMSRRLGAIEATLAQLAESVASLSKPKAAGTSPVAFQGEPKQKDFMTLAREYAAEKKCDMTRAMGYVAKTNPEAHRRLIGR